MVLLARIFFIILVVILQVSFLPTLLGGWPIPNLILAAVTVTLLQGQLTTSLWWAGVGGLFLDLSLPGRGYSTLLLTIILGLASLLIARFHLRSQGLPGFSLALAAATVFVTGEWLVIGNQGTWAWLAAVIAQLAGIGLVWGLAQLIQTSRFTRGSQRLKIEAL